MEAATGAERTWQPVGKGVQQPRPMEEVISLQNLQHSRKPTTDGEERMERGWKFAGYPDFSKWMASSNDFFVLRRFNALNARVLLRLQDQIAELEDDLESIDRACMEAEGDTVYGRVDSLRLDRQIQPMREDLLEQLTAKLERYNRYISTYSGIRDRRPASRQQLENVKNWTMNHPFAIDKQEHHVLHSPADAIALVDGNKSSLRLLIEKWTFPVLVRVRTDNSVNGTRYFNDRIIDRIENTIIVFYGLLFLFAPLWTLQFQMRTVVRLAIVTAFISFYTLVLAIGIGAKPFEILAAAAAYSAVLMVFLSQTVTISTST